MRRNTINTFTKLKLLSIGLMLVAITIAATAPATAQTRTLVAQTVQKDIAGLLPQTQNLPEKARIALIIGNSQYPQNPLVSPVKDAQAISRQLSKLGFHIIKRENADVEALQEALEEYISLLETSKGIGLFYYAGHGIQVNGSNYLIPTDVDLSRPQQVIDQSLALNRLLEQLGQARNQTNIMIIDACRDNPYSQQSGLAPLSYGKTPGNTFIAFATAPGNVAIDGNENGLFTQYILKHLNQAELPIEQMFKRVRQDVIQVSKGFQIPWENSSLTTDFYFKPRNLAAVAAASLNAVASRYASSTPADAALTPAPASVNTVAIDQSLLQIDLSRLQLGPAIARQSKPAARATATDNSATDKPNIDFYLATAENYLQQNKADIAHTYLDKAFTLSHQASLSQIQTLTRLLQQSLATP